MEEKTKDETIIWEYYRRAYKVATPSADFDKLVEEAPIVDGRKMIDYMAYELDDKVQEKIEKDILKEFRVPKYRHKAFRFEFHLGCGPKLKLDAE